VRAANLKKPSLRKNLKSKKPKTKKAKTKMKLHTLKTAVLALAGLALIASSVKAATLTYNDGDLFIGFVNGGTQDYVVDVGQASLFTTSSQLTLSVGATGTDLSSTFGGSWFGSTGAGGVLWGGAGTLGASDTVWATSTSSTPWAQSFDQSTPTNNISQFGLGAYDASTSTTNSNVALKEATSGGSSWASFESVANGGTAANSPVGSFAYFTPSIEGTTSQKLFLTKLTEGSTGLGQSIGFFQINSGGTITFTGTSAVPEPSTYALMILGGAALLFVTRFGRRSDLI
jgi:hypothetical protein